MSDLSLPMESKRRTTGDQARGVAGWMLLLVALLAFAVYANSLKNGFAFDDSAIVRDNVHVVNLEWTEIWRDNYWKKSNGLQVDVLYRPLTLWSYLANQWLAPGVPWPFHLVNVLLHAGISMLVTLLAWRLLGNRVVAVVTGLLFAVHPLHTEAVANTVGRAELLAALWTLLALLIFLPVKPLAQERTPTRRAWWHGILVAICFFAAILSKETPVALVLALPFIDMWRWMQFDRARRPGWWRWIGAQFLRYYLPCGIALGIYLAMRIAACGLMGQTALIHPVVNPLVDATLAQRLVTPFTLLWKYVQLTLWPVHLSADYSAPSIMPTANPLAAYVVQNILGSRINTPGPLMGVVIVSAAIFAAVRSWKKRPEVVLIIGLFFTSYALVANIIRIGTIFGERLFYWPSAFVLLLIAWGGVRLFELARAHAVTVGRVALPLLLAAAIVAMSYRTYVRNTDWADDIPLAISTARDNPYSAKACSWAGTVLILADRPEFVAVGKLLLDRSADLADDFVSVRWELAKFYGRRNELAKALISITQAAKLDPGSNLSRMAINAILIDLKSRDPKTYLPELIAYQAEHPKDAAGYLALAVAYHAQGKYDDAETWAVNAIKTVQDTTLESRLQFHEAAAEFARIRYDRGEKADGIAIFWRYVWHVRNSVDAFADLASLLINVDKADYPNGLLEAGIALAQAEKIDPGNARVRDIRGMLNRKMHQAEIANAPNGANLTASVLPMAGPAAPEPMKQGDQK